MRKLFAIIGFVISLGVVAPAQDITTLEKIGPVVSFTKTDKAVTFNCADNSQVQLTVLASDLIRVRAAFTKPIPTRTTPGPLQKRIGRHRAGVLEKIQGHLRSRPMN